MTMRGILAHKAARLVLTGTVVGASIAAGLFSPHPASAEIDLCQSDPIITITRADGSTTQLNVDAMIRTSPQNVSDVYYDIHIPSRATSWSIEYTGDIDPSHEHVTVSADAPSDQYISLISVSSSVHAAVVGTARMEGHSTSKSGTVDHPIRLHLIKH